MVFADEHFARVKAAASILTTESRKEDGCHHYQFSSDIVTENTLCFYEEWDSFDALNLHRRSEHNRQFKALVEEVGLISRDVKRYEIDRSNILE